jgi:predicted transposase YdaD
LSGPFDITLKHLIEAYPQDWLRLVGIPASGPVEVVDADLATVTAEADKLLRLSEPSPSLLHLEFQTTYDSHLADRIHWYNALAGYRHGLPVHSVAILMRQQADGSAMIGELRKYAPHQSSGNPYLVFRYQVVRVWQFPSEEILENGLGTLPLAILTDDASQHPAEIVERMKARMAGETDPTEVGTFWTATYSLMGLRYPSANVSNLLKGVRAMKDSVTYQAIVEEGVAIGELKIARQSVIRLGSKLFGEPPDEANRQRLESIGDVEVLQSLIERAVDVRSWQELLG